jgi:hypothetical protein
MSAVYRGRQLLPLMSGFAAVPAIAAAVAVIADV